MPVNRILASLLVLGVFAALLALGFWQLQRRDWKNDLLARLEQGLQGVPARYTPPATPEDDMREFTPVTLSGRWLTEQTVKILQPTPGYARTATTEGYGFQIFTPLAFEGRVIFVNRGFVAQNVPIPPPAPDQSVTGMIRKAEEVGMFTPAPDAKGRVFFIADLKSMAGAAGLSEDRFISAEYIEAKPAAAVSSTAWPKPRDPAELLAAIPNRHLGYAATWFGLAATLIGVVVAYRVRPREKEHA